MMQRILGLVGLTIVGLTTPAVAQVRINSTGIVTGTIIPPNRNPNFNNITTRIDTDSQGRYFRNGVLIFDASAVNPNLVGVDANGRYYVDFWGIPFVATNGALTSSVLQGQFDSVSRPNHNAPVKFWGNVQDETVVNGKFTGIATNPATGEQYQGTFDIRGQGPRYSDRNGGTSPTVFDFRSYYNLRANPQLRGTPTVFSYTIQGMPVNLTVTVPAGLQPIANPPVTPPGNTPPITPPIGNPVNPNPPVIAPPITPGPITPGPITPGLITPGPITPSGAAGSPPPVTADPTVFSSQQIFEVSRVVLEKPPVRPIGPRSRVILQR
jgi:hypothetical protein